MPTALCSGFISEGFNFFPIREKVKASEKRLLPINSVKYLFVDEGRKDFHWKKPVMLRTLKFYRLLPSVLSHELAFKNLGFQC